MRNARLLAVGCRLSAAGRFAERKMFVFRV